MAKVRKKIKTKKIFHFSWAYESFEDHESFYTKRMFGGLAVYLHGKMVMVLMESTGKKEYRGKTYKFELWNGILYPTEFDLQESIQKEFPDLIQHPILKKWLYLKSKLKNFDEIAESCSQKVRKNDKRFGIYPKMD
jgi:hypothetical protein